MILLGDAENELKLEMDLGKLIKYERLVCLGKVSNTGEVLP